MKYFKERYQLVDNSMCDNNKIYGFKITEYMEEAIKKAHLHRVNEVGAVERRFEVVCRDKARMGRRHEKHTQECIITNEGCV